METTVLGNPELEKPLSDLFEGFGEPEEKKPPEEGKKEEGKKEEGKKEEVKEESSSEEEKKEVEEKKDEEEEKKSEKDDGSTEEEIPEEFEKEWDTFPKEVKDKILKFKKENDEKFMKQSSGTQSIVTKSYNRMEESEKKLVEYYPERLIELSNSEDPIQRKLAVKLSKDVWGKSLEASIEEIKVAKKEAGEEIVEDSADVEKRAKRKAEEQIKITSLKDDFVKKSKILNDKDDGYNESIAKKFDDKFENLKEKNMLEEEIVTALEDAFAIATKDLSKIELAKLLKNEYKKNVSAGGGTGKKHIRKPKEEEALFDGLTETL